MMDPANMKVVDLRSELVALGSNTKGNKLALVGRLKKALESKTGKTLPNTLLDTTNEDVDDSPGTPRRPGPAAQTRRWSSSSRVTAIWPKAPRMEEPEPVIEEEPEKSEAKPESRPEHIQDTIPAKTASPVEAATPVKAKTPIKVAQKAPEKNEPDMPTTDGDVQCVNDVRSQSPIPVDDDKEDIPEPTEADAESVKESEPVATKEEILEIEYDKDVEVKKEPKESEEHKEKDELDIAHQETDGYFVPLQELSERQGGPSYSDFRSDNEADPEPQPDAYTEPSTDLETEVETDSELKSTFEWETPASSRGGRGTTGRGMAGCVRVGRVRGGRGHRAIRARGRGGNEWVRGQRLVHRYTTDEELPHEYRDEFGRLPADCEKRARTERECRVVLGERVAVDEEEEDFHSVNFVWETMTGYCPKKETFLPGNPGPTSVFESAYDSFRAYWDDSILSHIVTETNRYAQGIHSEKFRREWFETTIDEMLLLFAFWMMLGIIRMPTIKSCFSRVPLMETRLFRQLFTESRYWNLNRAFHLSNGTRDPNNPDNLLYPMGPILNHLKSKFQEHYVLDQEVSIDESFTLWKGLLMFMQYIKTKAVRYGIKTYELCESATGYVWNFFVHVGHSSTSDSTLPASAQFVKRLVQPILHRGHVLYMDNWFNSPHLAQYLKHRGTDCVGTLRINSKNVPPIIRKADLAEGQFVARQSGDVAVMALQDRKRLHLISTCHDTAQVQKERPGGPATHRLQLIDDYNRGKGGVDRKDQMLEPYLVERKQCKKWTKKLFKRFLNVSIQNARILLEKSSHSKVDSLSFRMTLVQSIMEKHLPRVSQVHPRQRRSYVGRSNRLTERHFIRRIEVTAQMRASTVHRTNLGRARCVWCHMCGRKKIKTVYNCPQCEVPLCLDRGCFELYHTVEAPGPEHM